MDNKPIFDTDAFTQLTDKDKDKHKETMFAAASADVDGVNINNTHKQYTQTSPAQAAGFAIGQSQKEAKTKRVNLLLQPSLYEKAQEVARINGVSFNEMITQLLRQITEAE